MENVGQSKSRNIEFQKNFSREKLLQNIVANDHPIIFDVGAHRGESIVYLKRIFPKAKIYSFEPDPDSFEVLYRTRIESVSYFNMAISNKNGSASFYRNKISHTNSLLKVNIESKDSIGIAKATAENDTGFLENFNKEIQVPTISLDSFTEQHLIDQIDLLKIDVQGAECHVLSGAKVKVLSFTKVIILEINFFDYYENQVSFMDVENILSPFGFRLFSISEISNNPMNGRTDWAEVVYLNYKMT